MFSSKNYLNLQSPSVKAWVEIHWDIKVTARNGSPSVKAWVEINWNVVEERICEVAFREGVSWNTIGHITISPRLEVAFREGVSWNVVDVVISRYFSGRLPWRRELKYTGSPTTHSRGRRLPWRRELKYQKGVGVPGRSKSPSVKAWVEMSTSAASFASIYVAFREGVSWNMSKRKFSKKEVGRLPWRRELKFPERNDSCSVDIVAFREGVSWNTHSSEIPSSSSSSPSVKAWVEIGSNCKMVTDQTVSPSVKAWVEIYPNRRWYSTIESPSVKAWVEISLIRITFFLFLVAFREGVSWNL